MSLVRALAFAMAAALALAAAGAEAQEQERWRLAAGLDYATLYVFRGLDLLGEDREVWTPHLALSVGNWNVWYDGYFGEFDALDTEPGTAGGNDYVETDLGLEYTIDLGALALTLGGVTYLYSGEVEAGLDYADTYEIYALAAWDVVLAPTLSYFHDVDAVDGGFLALDLSHRLHAGPEVSLDLQGQVGFDFGYNQPGDPQRGFDRSHGEIHHAMLGFDVPWRIRERLTAHAQVQRFFALDVADQLGQPDVTVVTIGATFDF